MPSKYHENRHDSSVRVNTRTGEYTIDVLNDQVGDTRSVIRSATDGVPVTVRGVYGYVTSIKNTITGVRVTMQPQLRRQEDVTYKTSDSQELGRAHMAFFNGEPITMGGQVGFITKIDPPTDLEGDLFFTIRLRPSGPPVRNGMSGMSLAEQLVFYAPPDNFYVSHEECDAYLKNCRCVPAFLASGEYPSDACEETDMNYIFEGVIVKIDEAGSPVEVVKVVSPFVGGNETKAVKQVLVDYCREANVSGEEAANLQVRLRTFCDGRQL